MTLLDRVRPRSTPSERGVADATGRLLRRRRQRRHRWLLQLLVAVLVLAVIGTAVWLFGFSRVFAAEAVQVSGTQLLSHRTVTDAADVPLGRPLAGLDVGAVAGRVRELKAVQTVTVERRWPHTVAITVTERTPVLAVRQNGASTLIDAEGIAFATVSHTPDGVAEAQVSLTDPTALHNVAAVAAALPAGVRGQVERIEANSAEGIRLQLTKGRTVVWGGADQSAVKGEVLAALLKRKASTYDVSGPANPTTRG